MPLLAVAARFAPWMVLVIEANLRTLDPRLLEAAYLVRVGSFQRWWRVTLPLMAPGLLTALGLATAFGLGELGATLLVAAPGQGTLVMRIYAYLHYGAGDQVAWLTLLMSGLALLAGLLALVGISLWQHSMRETTR